MHNQKDKIPNQLITETSPYLLQHAYNPVNWLPFSAEAFEKAKKEDKPLLISIGYSACHWCHVMEHESFEDREVADLMNTHFINVKVDREERSDVDMLYMQAVQLMTGHGGWPLNCFVLPDGRPFYGGTYFNKTQWLNVLKSLSNLYTNEAVKVNEYAHQLTQGIKTAEQLINADRGELELDKNIIRTAVANWKKRLDRVEGGPDRAPKFPLPSNYLFLLRFSVLENDLDLLSHVELTLKKMAFGGLYDQLRGGFCRYSTDKYWKVPHFEKMLYDNAQLVALYAEAYTHTKNELYREIVSETLNFIEDEWYQPEGNFFSALDADSDGEEGKYYVWTETDLRELLGDDYEVFGKYFEINEKGYWENGNYVLMRSDKAAEIMVKNGLNHIQLKDTIDRCKKVLLQETKSRIKPGLDDKTITSWNALMCSAYAKAYLSFGRESYKEIALQSINFILSSLSAPDGSLFRTYKSGKARIPAFLDDYAFVIEALIHIYLITQNEDFLFKARELTKLTLSVFENPDSVFLYYTSKFSEELITRTTETHDNVIPASNSQMAVNLFQLGVYFEDNAWVERSEKMLHATLQEMRDYASGYSNWGCLALWKAYPYREVAIVGKDVNEKLKELCQRGITNTILAVSKTASELPLLLSRFREGETILYVCQNKTCGAPVSSVALALKQFE